MTGSDEALPARGQQGHLRARTTVALSKHAQGIADAALHFILAEYRQDFEYARAHHDTGDGHAQEMVDVPQLDAALLAKRLDAPLQRGLIERKLALKHAGHGP